MTQRNAFHLLLLGAGIATAGSGCVVHEDANYDDFVRVDWGIEYVGAPNVPVPCDSAGTTQVQVIAQNAATGVKYAASTFNCAALTGDTAVLPKGNYNLTFNLLDDAGGVVSTLDLPNASDTQAVVVDNRYPQTLQVVFVVQSFSLAWSIEHASAPGVPINCTTAGAATVELETQLNAETPVVYSFPCTVGAGITTAVPTGNYTWSTQLKDIGGNILSSTTPTAFTALDTARAVLPTVIFPVN